MFAITRSFAWLSKTLEAWIAAVAAAAAKVAAAAAAVAAAVAAAAALTMPFEQQHWWQLKNWQRWTRAKSSSCCTRGKRN